MPVSPRLFRALAVCLVVLGVSPFTAPFSTCDLSLPIGDASATDTVRWLKPPADTDTTSVVAAAAGPFPSLVKLLVDSPLAGTALMPPRSAPLVLRV
jgi:hypothetical protein